jgi:hypothetical protein
LNPGAYPWGIVFSGELGPVLRLLQFLVVLEDFNAVFYYEF